MQGFPDQRPCPREICIKGQFWEEEKSPKRDIEKNGSELQNLYEMM